MEKAVSYTVHGFPIAIHIWAFEAVPEIGDRFSQRLGERSPRLLGWTSTKQSQQHTYDAFFKNVQLHVYATLRPIEIERGQPRIATLVLFNDHPVPALDDLARDSVVPQFQAERIGTPKEGTFEDETSDEAHDGGGTSGEEEESGADESGEAEGEDSEEHDSGDSDGDRDMLLDQRILFEMWLCTVKLEIMQHVSDEFKKLKDFISTIVPASGSTTTACATDVDPEPRLSDYEGFAGHHPSPDGIDEDMGIDKQEGDGMCINEEHMEPCLDEQDMPLPSGTESLQDIAHIQPCPEDHPVPEPSTIEEVQGGHHPSPGDRDKK
ncbi:Hypothetical predicted protein [Olea europaea subsp. europaea]|uniref:Uncharacterized protein n=1 Tax=Olea europaea subsp. europaea TaxID=158383 RepID=A0A8S0T5P9_OLEEU|nr:Hypothetical predicted protein [Olea europaea subsp. europaea]